MVKVTLKPGEEEKKALVDIVMKVDPRMRRSRIMYFLIGVVGVVVTVMAKGLGMNVYMVLSAMFASFGFFMCLTGLRSGLERATEQLNKDTDQLTRTYTIDADGVMISSPLGEGTYEWDKFGVWGHISGYIYLMRFDRNIVLIDKKQLSNRELDEIDGYFGRNIAIRRDK